MTLPRLAVPTARPSRPAGLVRRRRLTGGLLALAASAAGLSGLVAGCAAPPEPVEIERGPLDPNSFEVSWKVNVDTEAYGDVDQLFLRDESLIVYTDDKVVERIAADSGRPVFITNKVSRPQDLLYPPLLVDAVGKLGQVEQYLAFPKISSYVLFTLEGNPIVIDGESSNEAQLRRNLTSPSYAADGVVYAGTSDEHGGRLLKIDPTRPAGNTLERVLFRGTIESRPVVHQNLVFAADREGFVYGVNEDLTQAWEIKTFATEVNRGVRADLSVDDYALYVAGTDGTLYAIDRLSGQIRWRYLAGTPLYRRPIPTDEYVFQPVPDRGVVALAKTEGSINSRDPLWVAEEAKDVLSQDDRRIYLLMNDNSIGAYDKATGELLFRSQRSDFTAFARNMGGARIFAATENGQIFAIDPVLSRGQVGEVASVPTPVLPPTGAVGDAKVAS